MNLGLFCGEDERLEPSAITDLERNMIGTKPPGKYVNKPLIFRGVYIYVYELIYIYIYIYMIYRYT